MQSFLCVDAEATPPAGSADLHAGLVLNPGADNGNCLPPGGVEHYFPLTFQPGFLVTGLMYGCAACANRPNRDGSEKGPESKRKHQSMPVRDMRSHLASSYHQETIRRLRRIQEFPVITPDAPLRKRMRLGIRVPREDFMFRGDFRHTTCGQRHCAVTANCCCPEPHSDE